MSNQIFTFEKIELKGEGAKNFKGGVGEIKFFAPELTGFSIRRSKGDGHRLPKNRKVRFWWVVQDLKELPEGIASSRSLSRTEFILVRGSSQFGGQVLATYTQI